MIFVFDNNVMMRHYHFITTDNRTDRSPYWQFNILNRFTDYF